MVSRVGVETRRFEYFFGGIEEHGFTDTAAAGTGAQTVADLGATLSVPAADDAVAYNMGARNPFMLKYVKAVEFLFQITDTGANVDFHLGLSNGGADDDIAAHGTRLFLQIDNLTPTVDLDDATTESSPTFVNANFDITVDSWNRLRIALDEDVLTQSPPSTSRGLVPSFAFVDSKGLLRKQEMSETVSMDVAEDTMVSPCVIAKQVTDTAAAAIIIREIVVEYQLEL